MKNSHLHLPLNKFCQKGKQKTYYILKLKEEYWERKKVKIIMADILKS